VTSEVCIFEFIGCPDRKRIEPAAGVAGPLLSLAARIVPLNAVDIFWIPILFLVRPSTALRL